jgi:hypothetical protein
VIDAKTPQAALQVEGDDVRMNAKYALSSILWLQRTHKLTAMQDAQRRTCARGRGKVHLQYRRQSSRPIGLGFNKTTIMMTRMTLVLRRFYGLFFFSVSFLHVHLYVDGIE